jgi:RNA polymerase sigma factor (TIGR02999 family)
MSSMGTHTSSEITLLLQQMGGGDTQASEKLLSLVLPELRALARHYLRGERPGHTLQPTALVNEAYVRLVSDQARNWRSRAHFVGVSAGIMRRILIDHARKRQALKRGAQLAPIEISDERDGLSAEEAEELIALDTALNRLEVVNPRHRQVVELRYFGGLSVEETAEALNVSPITVKRDWRVARAWLKGQVRPTTLG